MSTAIEPQLDNIPADLRDREQWILWRSEKRDGDETKVPYQPDGRSKASTSTPATWTTFEKARQAYERGQFDGVGFVFTEEDPFVGIDLDGCVNGGDLTGGAWQIVKRLDSYTEGSPSGTGLHIIIRGFITADRNRTSDPKGLKELEVYEDGRYFTFTGRSLDSAPDTVEQRAQALHALCEEVFPSPEPATEPRKPQAPAQLEDQELVQKAKQFDDAGKFAQLWNGDTSAYGDDHSRADLALVNKLAFWTGGDRSRIDRLFRQSGLCREKWTKRPDYRERTINKALDGRTEFYEPSDPSVEHRQNGHAKSGSNHKDSASWEPVRSTYASNKAEGRVESASLLIDELNLATHRRSGQLYVWDEEAKVYDEGGEEAVRERLVETLQTRFSQHEVNEILGMVRPRTYRDKFGADGFIPVANGDLKVTADSVELADATPEHGFRNRSPAEWDPDAEAPIFQTYLEQVVHTEDERRALQEYAGYALMYWALLFHKALFLVGPQASGKSTFLKVLQQILGKTTQLSPQQLVDDQFGAIELEDSWANIRSDIPSELLSNVGKFKEITAGDPIHARRMYEQGYTIEPTAKHLYSANQLPEIKIDDDAFFRRVMIVAFPKTVPREDRDPKLDEKLSMELDGIFRWAVEGLQRLLTNEEFTRDLPPGETRRLWDEHASSIGQFKVRCLKVTDHNADVEAKEDVYKAYAKFCQDNGLPTESQRKLTGVLKRDPRIRQAKRKPEGWDKRAKCYVGIQFAPADEEDEIPENPF